MHTPNFLKMLSNMCQNIQEMIMCLAATFAKIWLDMRVSLG